MLGMEKNHREEWNVKREEGGRGVLKKAVKYWGWRGGEWTMKIKIDVMKTRIAPTAVHFTSLVKWNV
jgi:hypothetical protein